MIKKQEIRLAFEHEALLDLRKILFKRGITAQQFFTYIVHKTITKDELLTDIVDEAVLYSQDVSQDSDLKEINAEELYALIERGGV